MSLAGAAPGLAGIAVSVLAVGYLWATQRKPEAKVVDSPDPAKQSDGHSLQNEMGWMDPVVGVPQPEAKYHFVSGRNIPVEVQYVDQNRNVVGRGTYP